MIRSKITLRKHGIVNFSVYLPSVFEKFINASRVYFAICQWNESIAIKRNEKRYYATFLVRPLNLLRGLNFNGRFLKTYSIQFPFIKHSPVVKSFLVYAARGGGWVGLHLGWCCRLSPLSPTQLYVRIEENEGIWALWGYTDPVSFSVIDTEKLFRPPSSIRHFATRKILWKLTDSYARR